MLLETHGLLLSDSATLILTQLPLSDSWLTVSRSLLAVLQPLFLEDPIPSAVPSHGQLLVGKTSGIASVYWSQSSGCLPRGQEIPSRAFLPPIHRKHTLWKRGSMFPVLAKLPTAPGVSIPPLCFLGLASYPALFPL